MALKENPYCAGAGTRPPMLAGRARQLAQVEHQANQFEARRGAESIIWYGLRGMGKTVLLREVLDRLRDRGWLVGYHEARRDAGIGGSIAQILVQGHEALGRGKLARALSWLAELLAGANVSADVGDVSVKLGLRSHPAAPLPEDALDQLIVRLGEAAADAGVGAAFLLDELQLVNRHDLSALLHAADAAKDLPVALICAGLPHLPSQLAAAGTYAERLFYDRVDWLGDADIRQALTEPAEEFRVTYSDAALELLVNRIQSYPYFLQLYAEETWKAAGTPSDRGGYTISVDDVHAALAPTERRLEDGLYRIRLEKASVGEQRYLRAMAVLGDGRVGSGAVARVLGKTNQQVSAPRDRLIAKGVIYSPAHNTLDFAVPGFAAYLRRQFGDTRGGSATHRS
jgi:hypothetical protein